MANPFSVRIADLLSMAVNHGAAAEASDGRVRLGDLVDHLGNRSFGIVFVLFGLPNLIPIPVLPMLCGVVIGVVSLQMLLGRESLVLPGWLASRGIRRADLVKVIARARPSLLGFEKLSRPRLLILSGSMGRRLIGATGLVLAVTLMAPIPFLGGIPPGLAVSLLGLALAERDGYLMIAGYVMAGLAIILIGALTFTLVTGLLSAFKLLGTA